MHHTQLLLLLQCNAVNTLWLFGFHTYRGPIRKHTHKCLQRWWITKRHPHQQSAFNYLLNTEKNQEYHKTLNTFRLFYANKQVLVACVLLFLLSSNCFSCISTKCLFARKPMNITHMYVNKFLRCLSIHNVWFAFEHSFMHIHHTFTLSFRTFKTRKMLFA